MIAPPLAEGVGHVRDCLDLEVPFGTRHDCMGTHNHRLLLGDEVYLEIVAIDPHAPAPRRARWFGLDNAAQVRADWDSGRRLRGWVASTRDIAAQVARFGAILGDIVRLPDGAPSFAFTIPGDGSLPSAGALPSLIDHCGDTSHFATLPDLGARLQGVRLEHPDPARIEALYREMGIADPPLVAPGPVVRYAAQVRTPGGLRALT